MSYPAPQGYPNQGYPPQAYSTQVVTPLPPRSSTGHVVTAWILTVLTGFYLLPWAIAATRNKRNVVPIVLINIFLGWSVLGWIAALVMACLNDDRPAAVVITHQPVWSGPAPSADPRLYPPQPQGYQPQFQPRDRPQPPYQLPGASSGWPSSQPTAPYRGYADEPTQIIDDGGEQRRY